MFRRPIPGIGTRASSVNSVILTHFSGDLRSRLSGLKNTWPPLKGEKGSPREWVYTEYNGKAWVRNKDWKLYRDGRLFDMKHDPDEKKPVDDNSAKEARKKLQAVLERLKKVQKGAVPGSNGITEKGGAS